MTKYAHFIIFILLQAVLTRAAGEVVTNSPGSRVKYGVESKENHSYLWEVLKQQSGTPPANPDDYKFITDPNLPQVTIQWNEMGDYLVKITETDPGGCTNAKAYPVQIRGGPPLIAGNDTTIGSCTPYTLGGVVEDEVRYSFLWQPGIHLDDSTKARPVFTPGPTTLFTLTVKDNTGYEQTDSVLITVAEIQANAGDDILMRKNATAMLDGSQSIGTNLSYQWSTVNGKIDSGGNTASPIVSGFGMYYLEVTDTFDCTSIDSTEVLLLAHAPVANDDYDTTSYLTEVQIPVLDNDTDEENAIDSLTLRITTQPFNGEAYVNYDDFTIHYTPDENFSGTDNFVYRICNIYDKCDEASVYVFVTEYRFYIPDAFSPNNDNINDYFEIVGIERYENNSISIFNRWGNKVYEARNYGISTSPLFWDGKSNTGIRLGNDELPTGSYYFILNLGNGEKPIAGSVYLDR